jgi:hypothetical protein
LRYTRYPQNTREKIAEFYGTDIHMAAFDANGGIFEPLLGEGDAIFQIV